MPPKHIIPNARPTAKTLPELWEEMEQSNFDEINNILSVSSPRPIETPHGEVIPKLKYADKFYLPELLLFSMHLKKSGNAYADKMIQQIIEMMVEVDIQIDEHNKMRQKHYSVAINDLLSIPETPKLLRDVVHSLEQYVRYEDNATILHKAAQTGHPEIIRLLFEAGWREVDKTDNYGETPFWISILYENIEVVQELLRYNPDIIRLESYSHPIIQVAANLRLWEEIFIAHAQANFNPVPYQLPKGLFDDIRTSKDEILEVRSFLEKMGFDTSTVGALSECYSS